MIFPYLLTIGSSNLILVVFNPSFNQMRCSIKETITDNHHPYNYHAIITICHRYFIYKIDLNQIHR